MHAPEVPLYAWWIVSIAATLVYLVFFVWLMPVRKYKVQVCFGPVFMAVFGVTSALLKGLTLEMLLPMYSTAALVLPAGLAGHHRELRQMILDHAEHGESAEHKPSRGMLVQLTFAVIVLGALMAWFTFV